jgi:hypothetical protein
MARKIAGLWCFNKEPGDVKGMHVNTTEHVSLWLYVQVSSGELITRDMLSWRDEIEVP